MACDDQERPPGGKLLAHDPVAATASTHETDLVGLPAGAEEEAILAAPPSLDHNAGRGLDPYVADHRARRGNGLGP